VVLKRDNEREKKKGKRLQRKVFVAGTSTLPKLKLNQSRINSSAKKSLWKPSRVSANLVDEDDSDVSWTGISYIKRLNKSLLILCRKN
jgi:hypothetical protein